MMPWPALHRCRACATAFRKAGWAARTSLSQSPSLRGVKATTGRPLTVSTAGTLRALVTQPRSEDAASSTWRRSQKPPAVTPQRCTRAPRAGRHERRKPTLPVSEPFGRLAHDLLMRGGASGVQVLEPFLHLGSDVQEVGEPPTPDPTGPSRGASHRHGPRQVRPPAPHALRVTTRQPPFLLQFLTRATV